MTKRLQNIENKYASDWVKVHTRIAQIYELDISIKKIFLLVFEPHPETIKDYSWLYT